jgi:hypothetical protein
MTVMPNDNKGKVVGQVSTKFKDTGGFTLGPILEAERKIQAKYDALGGAALLGEPTDKQLGSVWTLPNGACICYDRHSSAAYHVYGEIYRKWIEFGGLKYGAPSTDESPTPDGVGRYNHFNNNTASIYWSPQTGAHAIWGEIRRRWSELGWENSYLGYPTSSEMDFPQGGRTNTFQRGDIFWWPDTGPIDLGDVVVHYTGFYCFGETEEDMGTGADEIYIAMGVFSPSGSNAATTRIYEGVNDGHSQPDLMELFRGRAYGMEINIRLLEHDFGDVSEDRKKMMEAFKKAHDEGVKALGTIPYGIGAIAALAADALLGKVIPELGGAIFDLFDLGDDTIGKATIRVDARDMVLKAARGTNSEFKGIGYRIESPNIKQDDANYKVYFGLVRA